jgi:hypothetical protein
MHMKLFPLLTLFLLSASLWGQVGVTDSIFEPKLSGTVYELPTGYTGSPFYYFLWLNGDILLRNGEWVHNKMLKYDGFKDALIWQRPDDSLMVELDKPFIEMFSLSKPDGTLIRFKKMKIRKYMLADTAVLFMEVLTEKKASCYAFRSIIVKGHDILNINGLSYSFGNLVKQPVYYLELPDQNVVSFRKIRKRLILNALPEEYLVKAKEILRNNHITLRDESDLISFTQLLE